jgi:hypothetical protein
MSDSPFAATNAVLGEPTYTFEDLHILARDALALTSAQRELIRRGADENLDLRRMIAVLGIELAQCRQQVAAVSDQLTAERRRAELTIPHYALFGSFHTKLNGFGC